MTRLILVAFFAVCLFSVVEHVAGQTKKCYQCGWVEGITGDACSDENLNLDSPEVEEVACPDNFCFKAKVGDSIGSRGCDNGLVTGCSKSGTASKDGNSLSCCNNNLCNGGIKGLAINFTVVVAAVIFAIYTGV
ncbi:uncharacterized protein [Amphiura filiformis]|uniref:uncharacterized protein n=1 Tax=Amphiura filiformis TaxID=82378 RepID=UPI003B21F978